MDKNVNIKFNATDGGSFEKFAGKYKDLLKQMSGGSTGYKTNRDYIFDEMKRELDFYDKKIKKEKEIYDLKVRQMKELASMSNRAFNDLSHKNISQSEFDSIENKIKNQEKAILKGTGKRSWSTYQSSVHGSIADQKSELSSKASLMDDTNNLLRQILNTSREEADIQIRQIKGNKGSTQAELLAAELAEQQIAYEKGKEKPKEPNIINSIILADALIKGMDAARGIATSKNGFDAFDKLGTLAENAATGITGIVMKGLAGLASKYGGKGAGDLVNSASPFVEKAVGTLVNIDWETKSNTVKAREQLNKSLFGFRALTGRNSQSRDLSEYGFNYSDFAGRSSDVARSLGSSKGAEDNASKTVLLERAFGINVNTSSQLLDLMRSMNQTDRNLTNLVGGVWEKGQSIFKGDRTYLNEFIQKNFTSLQRELTKNQTSVASGTTLDILARFNAVGGQFGAQHQNSMGLITTVNNALTNPNSDNANALSFNALRQLNPSAGIFDLLKMRQQGVRSPGYLKAMLGMTDRIGGDTQMKKYNFASLMGMTDNLDAAEELYNGRGNFSRNFSKGDLKSKMSINGLMKEAGENTPNMERYDAKMFNKMVQGGYESMKEIAKELVAVVDEAFKQKTFVVYGADGSKMVISGNKTQSPNGQSQNKLPPWGKITDPNKIMEWRMLNE